MTEPHNTPVPYGAEGDFETEVSNTTHNPHFADVLKTYMERRGFLKGALGAAVGVALAGNAGELLAKEIEVVELEKSFLDNAAKNIGLPLPTRPTFQAISTARTPGVTVPAGYTARVALRAGEPIAGSYPAYKPDGSNTGAEQEQQIGQHHDGMHYFAIPGFDPNRRGIMAINHEYIEQRYLFPAGTTFTNPRPADAVRKEVAAHGVSIVEIEKQANGDWSIVRGPYNRRITGGTPMEITGPARGHPKMVTAYSPDGTMTRGTLNNCGNGYTPWGTYLTCEENWAGYFVNRDTSRPREHTRFGVPGTNSRYGWETAQERFDCSTKATSAAGDFRNEVNNQGWIVEIDPYDPTSVPKKRTGLGRFAHEGCIFAPPRTGKPYVFYSGDDSQNEYIYKFVTRWVHVPDYFNRDALAEGTLYVAKFNNDGTGSWIALDINNPAFRAAAEAAGVAFADQGDVLINTRLAADVVGATRMDRPEWGTVDPRDGRVYFTLTNNSARTAAQVDPMNPRGPNPFGHIIRWREDGDVQEALTFRWEILLLSGTETDSLNPLKGAGARLDANSIHASPDGLWIDYAGTLWIQTDMSGSQQSSGPFGENSMLAMDTRTGEIRRFLSGPPGQEVTGVITTPDLRTMFINLQHPNEGGAGVANAWPDGPGTLPRSATVIINKNDGGIIGT
jgi:secreted PhoX family phosphatase